MPKNGIDWVKFLFSVLIITVLPFMAKVIWSNDRDARDRDTKIREQIYEAVVQQQDVNQSMLVELTEIKTDLKYVKNTLGGNNEKLASRKKILLKDM